MATNKQKITAGIMGGLAGILMASNIYAQDIKGFVGFSYVPLRIDDQTIRDELKSEFRIEFNWELFGNTFYVGNHTEVFSGKPQEKRYKNGFNPHRINPDFFLGYKGENWDIYARHNSMHPIESEKKIVQDENGENYIVGDYDYIEEIGFRYKFGGD